MRRVMADPNPSAKMERKTQRRPAEIKPRIIERRGKKGGKPNMAGPPRSALSQTHHLHLISHPRFNLPRCHNTPCFLLTPCGLWFRCCLPRVCIILDAFLQLHQLHHPHDLPMPCV